MKSKQCQSLHTSSELHSEFLCQFLKMLSSFQNKQFLHSMSCNSVSMRDESVCAIFPGKDMPSPLLPPLTSKSPIPSLQGSCRRGCNNDNKRSQAIKQQSTTTTRQSSVGLSQMMIKKTDLVH